MSTGSQKVAGTLDFEESNPEVAPAGVSRLFRSNGLLRVSADGAAAGAMLGGLPSQRLLDANTTIAVADGKSLYYYPTGIIGAARTITISAAGGFTGWSVMIAVLGAQGFDVLIRDSAATLLHTIPAGAKQVFSSFFLATNLAANNGVLVLP